MLICDRCDARIPEGARFCPACGDPVTAADKPGARPGQRTERVHLVCPRCERQSLFDIPAHGTAQGTCPACGGTFATRVVRIRSKRSAGNKGFNTRSFTVRIEELGGRDDLIEFVRPGNEDFELKSKDLAAFSYLEGKLHVVQNLTVGRYMRVALPVPGCGGGMAAAAVVLLVMLGFCGVIFSGSDSETGSHAPSYPQGISTPPIPATTSAPRTDLLYAHGALNVRSMPSRNAGQVRTLARGDLVRLGPKDENGWAPLYDVSGRQEGYVYRASDLIRSSPPAQPSVTQPRRPAGARRYITGPRGGCYYINGNGNRQYVDRSLCH